MPSALTCRVFASCKCESPGLRKNYPRPGSWVSRSHTCDSPSRSRSRTPSIRFAASVVPAVYGDVYDDAAEAIADAVREELASDRKLVKLSHAIDAAEAVADAAREKMAYDRKLVKLRHAIAR